MSPYPLKIGELIYEVLVSATISTKIYRLFELEDVSILKIDDIITGKEQKRSSYQLIYFFLLESEFPSFLLGNKHLWYMRQFRPICS
jgi:hypothetical protein